MSDPSASNRHGAVLETLRAVNAAVVRGNTRESVEQAACDRLVSGAYEGAWLLEPPIDDEATVRAGAGEEFPETARELAMAPGPDGSVLSAGDRSFVAVPCSHDGTTAAVLVVVAPSIDDAEREVLLEIGATIAHGLAAIRRKTALMNETEVELELRIRDAVDPIFDDPDPDASFEFVRTIPLDDDAFLQYVAVEGMEDERFEREMDTFAGIDWVRRVGGDGERTLYETRYVDPSIVGTVAAAGSRVVEASVAEDDLDLVARVPDERAVDRIVASVSERFPDAEVRARRALVEAPTADELVTTAFDRLTDRQRTVLETAYVGGYFDRPRRSTGEDLAASLDVSPSTFYQHLRAGQRKVFEVLFDD